MSRADDRRAIRRTGLSLSALAVAMFAFCLWVMPPLYTLFCELTGINGKTSSEVYTAVPAEVDTERTVRVRFLATKNVSMPWAFAPSEFELLVHPGEAISTYFVASNPTAHYMVGQAVPSMDPKNATDYFHKTECFCFNQQVLAPGERAELGLRFVVDQALPKNVSSITLAYTLFDVTERSADQIEQAKQARLVKPPEILKQADATTDNNPNDVNSRS